MKDESHSCIREDFCPTMEWLPFNGICYLFLEEQLNADNNLERCASMNASMVRVEDAAVHLTLQQEMARRGITQIWIAANERGTKNHWVWGPGDPVVNEGWAPGEPFGFNKECVILKTNGWNDVNCVNFVSNAVCEASAL
ncbi:CD209 antigen-like protein E [Pecten maximus]|uniref:CD209 antigen-like protein E n=1 Tax=Pecten maximus TaxID=6579 RepID=UPI001458D2F2|nr:CD209 antigen-like protein E [Pecten maximus]